MDNQSILDKGLYKDLCKDIKDEEITRKLKYLPADESIQPLGPNTVQYLNKTYQNFLNDPESNDEYEYVRIGVHGTGNCFFCCLCYALNYCGYQKQSEPVQIEIAEKFRKKYINHQTKERKEKFCDKKKKFCSLNVEKLTNKLRNEKAWADQEIIEWTSEILRKNIVFIDSSKKAKLYCGVENRGGWSTIIILWINNSHFELVGRKNEYDIEVQFEKDHHIMSQYDDQCPTS